MNFNKEEPFKALLHASLQTLLLDSASSLYYFPISHFHLGNPDTSLSHGEGQEDTVV